MSESKSITINIDGDDFEVPAGANLVDVAEKCGVEIPHYCYHPHLSVSGNCRMCLVELGMPMKDRATGDPVLDDDGKQKIGFMPKPAIACSTKTAPGMHVKTKSPMIKDCRNGVMEFLLVNHPLDCPICDQAGECRLQEFATDYGRGYSRFVEDKNVKPKRTKLGPRVVLDDERCILCSRCIRFSQEIAKDDVLGFIDRGSYSTLTCYPGKELENNYSLNTVDICPVGALTSVDFRFKMRVWFLKPSNSICTESSTGVNTQVWSREGKIYRITPRRNDDVNDSWMSDSGRMLYKPVDSDDRLTTYCVDGTPRGIEVALSETVSLLKAGGLAYVGSGHMSVEEQFLLKSIRSICPGSLDLVSHSADGDDLLVSKDQTPNVRGALVTGLTNRLPANALKNLSDAIDAGKVKTVICFGENLVESGLSEKQLKTVKVIYLGSLTNICSQHAKIILPTLMVFEKQGTFINQQFRLQKFEAAVPGPKGVLPDYQLLSRIEATLSDEASAKPTMTSLWSRIAKSTDTLKEISFQRMPDEGCLLDGSPWKNLPFCEGENLHFKPTLETAKSASGLTQ